MRERRRGAFGRATEIAEGVAAAVRRAQREREPRILLHDETGFARLLQPESRGWERVHRVCEQLVDAAGPAREPHEPHRPEPAG